MDVTCPNCGTTNRSTSRFCARCGQSLSGKESPQGAPGVELPWLQAVQDRSVSSTGRLNEGQAGGEDEAGGEAQGSEVTAGPPPAAQISPSSPVGPAHEAPELFGQSPANVEGATLPGESTEEAAQPQAKGPDDTELPQWVLSILEPEAAPQPKAEEDYDPEELSHIMPWAHGPAPGEEGAPPPEPGTPGLPPWLKDITVQETLQASPESASEAAQLPPELDLEEIEPFVPPDAVGQKPETSSQPVKKAPSKEQVPAWLRAMKPEAPAEAEIGPQPEAETGGLEAPGGPTATDTLRGITNTPVRPPRPGSVETLAALLQPATPEVSRRAVAGVPSIYAERKATGGGLARWLLPDGLIYLLILASLLTVLSVRLPFGDVNAPAARGVQEFYGAIEDVPATQPVLVVYDWDATRSAEMSTLSQAVMHHLMARRLRFVTVSTVPQGPGFAQQVTAQVANDAKANYGYVYGRDYLVLGYIPGSEAGLRALSDDFSRLTPLDYVESRSIETFDLTRGGELRGIEDFALIINLTSEEGDLRNWIEQVATRTQVPLVAAVPQSLEPLARPFLNVPNAGLDAVMSGTTGALQYARLLELRGRGTGLMNSTGTLTDRLHAQSIAQVLLALVIVAGLLAFGTRKILRR